MTIVVLFLYAISYLRIELDLARPEIRVRQSIWHLPNLLFAVFLIAVIIDGTPLLVDYLRQAGVLRSSIDWDTTYSRILNNLLIYGSVVAFVTRFLFIQKKIRPNAIKYGLLAITWAGLFLSIVLLVNRIHYGRPPNQLSILIPFLSIFFIATSGFHILFRPIVPIKAFRLFLSALISALVTWMLIYFSLLPYSIYVRQASKKIGELTRPITPFVEAISEGDNSWEKEFDPSEIKILEELKKGKRRLESYSGLTWKEEIDNQENFLVSFLEKLVTPLLYGNEENKKLMMSSGQRDVTLEWNLLSPVRPFEYDDAIDYLETFSLIDQIPINKRNRLRDVQEKFAKKQLIEAVTRNNKFHGLEHEEILCALVSGIEFDFFELKAISSLLKKVYPDVQDFPGHISKDFFDKITSAEKSETIEGAVTKNGISLSLVEQHLRSRKLDREALTVFLQEIATTINDIQRQSQPSFQDGNGKKRMHDAIPGRSSEGDCKSYPADDYLTRILIETLLISCIREGDFRFDKSLNNEITLVSRNDLELILQMLVGDSCINSHGKSSLPSITLSDFMKLLKLESHELGCLIAAISMEKTSSDSSFMTNDDQFVRERDRDHRSGLRNVIFSNILGMVDNHTFAESLFKSTTIGDVLGTLFRNGKPECNLSERLFRRICG